MGSHLYFMDGGDHAGFYGAGKAVKGLYGQKYPVGSIQDDLNADSKPR